MVEGHQVHRTRHHHAAVLKGKAFKATSPNGRFADGAASINARVLADVQAVGKNLAYVFTRTAGAAPGTKAPAKAGAAAHPSLPLPADAVVVRVHFGMSGRHAAYAPGDEPAPTATTRLRLEAVDGTVVTHLSAMTVEAGGPEVLTGLLAGLGPDPLREDADPERFWAALQASRRSVGFELMRQEAIAGVGNIYRAEILHFAGVHPDTPAADVTRSQFEAIWGEAVRQLQAGFELGSIVTVPPSLAAAGAWVDSAARRVVYNRPRCAKCGGKVVSWDINARTAYACEACQPPPGKAGAGAGAGAGAAAKSKKAAPRIFSSRCAPEEGAPALVDGGAGIAAPAHLTVPQLRAALGARGVAAHEIKAARTKAALVARLQAELAAEPSAAAAAAVKAEEAAAPPPLTPGAPPKRARRAATASATATPGTAGLVPADAAAAAAEKAAAGEGRNVEHVAQDAGDATVWLAPAAAAARAGAGAGAGAKGGAAPPVAPPVTPAAPAKARRRSKRAAV